MTAENVTVHSSMRMSQAATKKMHSSKLSFATLIRLFIGSGRTNKKTEESRTLVYTNCAMQRIDGLQVTSNVAVTSNNNTLASSCKTKWYIYACMLQLKWHCPMYLLK